jgi:cytochrome c oxidase cbb3-type subunit III
MRFRTGLCIIAALSFAGLLSGQGHQPTPQQRQTPNEDPAAVARGRALFQSSCGFCHGNDATGSRAPDLVRSAVTLRDDNGNTLGPVIRKGRPDKGMPSFATLKDDQIASIVGFLHHQAEAALHSAKVPGDYPVAKLLTGNAEAGKEFFNGAGACAGCHSVTGDLAGVAKKFSPIDLQQEMVYPSGKHVKKKAVVTLPDGKRLEGTVVHDDEFSIGITAQDGWYRAWPKSEVKVEVHDPLEGHQELMSKYTDADLHNLFAYLETLK